jgi:hypothetical protein
MRLLALLLAAWPFTLTGSAQPAADNDPQALLRRAIQAHGGADKLDRLRQVQEETTGTLQLPGKKVAFTSETLQQLPGRFRHVLTSEVGGKKLNVVQVYDGKQGWVQEGGLTRVADEKTLAGWQAMAHAAQVASLTPLLAADKGYALTLLAESKVRGKPARGIKVACAQQRDVCLWFDRETGLLVKRDSRPHAGGPESVQEEIYSDFKDVSGLKRPTRVQVLINGVPHVEATIRSTRLLERVDDKEFSKPR